MIRTAIYFTPSPTSPLGTAAAEWLKRDIYGRPVSAQPFTGLPAEKLAAYLASPFHYGFHATVKPPFQLKEAGSIDIITERLEKYAADKPVIALPPLELRCMDSFFCLRPSSSCPQLHELVDDVVRKFDDLRKEPLPAEIEKRRNNGLTENQDKMLLQWGYPFVMEEFRFHMTLTGRIHDLDDRAVLQQELGSRFHKDVCSDILFNGLSLFIEEDKKPLLQHRFFPFKTL